MERVIFGITRAYPPSGEPYSQIALVRPPTRDEPRALNVDPSKPPLSVLSGPVSGDDVRAAGRCLFDAVMAHPGVAKWLTSALTATGKERYGIHVQVGAGELAQTLPWETLWAKEHGFVGLDPRWPLSRLVDGPSAAFTYPTVPGDLHIAAVLSCLGVPSAEEWRALRAAADHPGFGTAKLLVLVSEPGLYDEIAADPLAQEGRLEVRKVVDDTTLLRDLRGFEPHILHLFCHGSVAGEPHLVIAVGADWATGTSEHSVRLEAKAFAADAKILPLVALINACGSAAPAGPADNASAEAGAGSRSLALELVQDGVTSAAIGMREPVTSANATTLTAAFYHALGEELVERGAAGLTGEPVDWPSLLRTARLELIPGDTGLPRRAAAASSKDWTQPVLYTRPPAAVPARAPAPPAPRAEAVPGDTIVTARSVRILIDHLTHLIGHLPPDTPPAAAGDLERALRIHLARLENTWPIPGRPHPTTATYSAATPSPAMTSPPERSDHAPSAGP